MFDIYREGAKDLKAIIEKEGIIHGNIIEDVAEIMHVRDVPEESSITATSDDGGDAAVANVKTRLKGKKTANNTPKRKKIGGGNDKVNKRQSPNNRKRGIVAEMLKGDSTFGNHVCTDGDIDCLDMTFVMPMDLRSLCHLLYRLYHYSKLLHSDHDEDGYTPHFTQLLR